MGTEYRLQRKGIVQGDASWRLRCDGSLAGLSGEGKDIKIDARQQPDRIRLSDGEVVIDMMRFTASPEAIRAITDVLRVASQPMSAASHPASSGTAMALDGRGDDLSALADASLAARTQSASRPKAALPIGRTNAARLSSVGGVVGLVIMFLLPTGSGVLPAAIIGMICGAGGCGLGCAVGSFLDALAAGSGQASTTKKDWSALSIVSLVLGTIGLIAWILPVAGVPVGVGGVVCGAKGARSSKRAMGLAGMGMSLACLLLAVGNGILGILVSVRGH